jgi:hypothetical protein
MGILLACASLGHHDGWEVNSVILEQQQRITELERANEVLVTVVRQATPMLKAQEQHQAPTAPPPAYPSPAAILSDSYHDKEVEMQRLV